MRVRRKANRKARPIAKKPSFFESLFEPPKENKVKKKVVKRSKKLIKKSKLEIKLKKTKMKKLKAAKIKAMNKAKLEKAKKLKAAKLKKQREKMLKASKEKVKAAKEAEPKVKVKSKEVGFFDSLLGFFKEEEHVKKEIKELKENGKIKSKFEEEYEDYIKRKKREREEPEHEKIKKIPTVKEIRKRALPVGLKHEKKLMEKVKKKGIKETEKKEWVMTGVPGFDELFEKGIPKGSAVLVAGGAGSGKTIFCLQTLEHNASHEKKCVYMSFEESEERLASHMKSFGWDAEKLIKSGQLRIQRFSPFDITRSVDAMLAKEKGELLIDIDPVILPEGFKPDIIVLDSLTAVASAFTGREDSYRIYIEQLFRFFEKIGCTSFLITETKQIPEIFSSTGVEEFLADGVIVLYNIKRGNIKESAIEVLKMRGEKHQKKIVAMQITSKGLVVYPEQEVFGGLEESK